MRWLYRLVPAVGFALLVDGAGPGCGQDPPVVNAVPREIDRWLATLSLYDGPPPVLLRTGEVRPPPPPAWFAAAWVCGERVAEEPARLLLSRLPALRRAPEASRAALLARSADENPAVAAWALVALAAVGPCDATALETLRRRTTAADPYVRRTACAILFHEGDDSGAAERALARDVERDGVDALALRMLSARHDIRAELAAAIMRALERDLPQDRIPYTLRAVREHARWFELSVPRIEALVPTAGRDAVMALGAIGKAAVPSLASILATTHSQDDREAALGSLQALGETESLLAFLSVARIARSSEETPRLRRHAVRTLGAIRTADPASAVRILRGLLAGDATRDAAAAALLRCATAPEVRTAAIEASESGGWSSEALLAVSELGIDARDVAPRIVRAWRAGRFSDVHSRIFALRALGRTGAADDDSIAVLASALNDPERGTQDEALEALRRLAPAARSTLPMLLEECIHGDPDRRSKAAAAVLAFDPESDVAWRTLEGEIESADPNRRGAALHSLAGSWETSEKARDLVQGRLDDGDISLRIAACEVVIEHHGADERIVRTLTSALGEPGAHARPAMRLLGRLGARAAPALPLLRALIYGPDYADAWAARRASDLIHRALADPDR